MLQLKKHGINKSKRERKLSMKLAESPPDGPVRYGARDQAIWLLLFISSALAAVASPINERSNTKPPLLLISLDGFRHDYLTLFKESTPNLNRLAQGEGAYAARVQPAYMTKTAANHWTLVTGLHQEVHGIVNNQMFDPVFNQTVDMFNTDDERWWNTSEPIWLTAEAHRQRTGVYRWPGGHVAIGGRLPTFLTPRTEKGAKNSPPALSDGLDKVLDWLTNGQVSLVVAYHDEPDFTAHGKGPGAVGPVLAEIDAAIGRFFGQLEERGLRQRVNVIITSDHGMLPVNHNNTIRVKARSHPATRAVLQMGVALGLFAKPDRAAELLAAMRDDIGNKPARAVHRLELPDRLHYKGHRRIPDVLLMPAKGYQMADTADTVWKLGMHGGEPDWDEMQVPLLATGPDFASGARATSVAQQTDIYGLACRLIGLPARPHNGSEQPLASLLVNKQASLQKPASVAALLFLLLLLLWPIRKSVCDI